MKFCDNRIHNSLKLGNEPLCYFCGEILMERKKVVEDILMERKKVLVQCCDDQDLRIDDGVNVCFSCGFACFYNHVSKRPEFHTRLYRIRRKLVCQSKYPIEYVLNDICYDNRVGLTHNQRDQIHEVFI